MFSTLAVSLHYVKFTYDKLTISRTCPPVIFGFDVADEQITIYHKTFVPACFCVDSITQSGKTSLPVL